MPIKKNKLPTEVEEIDPNTRYMFHKLSAYKIPGFARRKDGKFDEAIVNYMKTFQLDVYRPGGGSYISVRQGDKRNCAADFRYETNSRKPHENT